jgi:hypothetical protein
MAIARSFRALELYDVLANLIPGSVLLLSITAIIKIENYFQTSNSVFATGGFLVSAFVLGHVIQAFASYIQDPPRLFGEIVQATREDSDEALEDDLPINLTHIERALWPLMKERFDLPDSFDDYGNLFRLLLSYIETTPATRALRFQAIHSFHRSMWAVWHLVIGITLVAASLNVIGLLKARSPLVLGTVVLMSIAGIRIFATRMEKFNIRFIQYAIIDFYSEQVSHQDESRIRDFD